MKWFSILLLSWLIVETSFNGEGWDVLLVESDTIHQPTTEQERKEMQEDLAGKRQMLVKGMYQNKEIKK